MTQLTNEQIIEGMAKAAYDCYAKHGTYTYYPMVEGIITYLTSIGYQITKIEPDTGMMRALLVEIGYDPDAPESTLDMLGQIDLATAGKYLKIYRAMSAASRITVKDSNDT